MPIFGVPMLQNAHFFFSNCKMPKTPYIFFIWLFWVCFRYCKMPIFAQNGHFATSVSVNNNLQTALLLAGEGLIFLNVWGLWPQTDSLGNGWHRPARLPRLPVGPRRGSVRPSIVTPGLGGHTQRSLCVRNVTNRLMYSIKNHTPNVHYVWGTWPHGEHSIISLTV